MQFTIATAMASFRTPEQSEDRLAVHHVAGGVVVVVADGAGGIPGGGKAADLALLLLAERVGDPHFNPFSADSWPFPLVEADREIEHDRAAGETTCVVVAVADDGRVLGASCGDSGALIVEADGSTDDLTGKQRRKLRLGSGRAAPVVFERPNLDGTLVVATDGLLAYMRPKVVAGVVAEHHDLDEAVAKLVEAVRLPTDGYQDDVAIVLVRHR